MLHMPSHVKTYDLLAKDADLVWPIYLKLEKAYKMLLVLTDNLIPSTATIQRTRTEVIGVGLSIHKFIPESNDIVFTSDGQGFCARRRREVR